MLDDVVFIPLASELKVIDIKSREEFEVWVVLATAPARDGLEAHRKQVFLAGLFPIDPQFRLAAEGVQQGDDGIRVPCIDPLLWQALMW